MVFDCQNKLRKWSIFRGIKPLWPFVSHLHPSNTTGCVKIYGRSGRLTTFIRMKQSLPLLPKRNGAYVIFTILFFIFWFLFKMGGMPDIGQAIASAFVDIAITILTILLLVEWLVPKYFYRNRYIPFFISFFLLVFISGSAIILLQLK